MTDDLIPGDLYAYESLLADDEREELAGIRSFLREEVRPGVNEHWAAATFPMELVPRFAEAGLVGRSYDTEGSPRASRLFTGFIALETARVDPSMATFLGVHNGLAMGSIVTLGSEEQKARWLPGMLALEKIGCFALTEPHGGSDVALGLETTARRDGDEWVLDGAKRWIGNGTFADLVVVFARDVADDSVKTFVVEKGTPGFSATKMEGKYALRTVQNADITFEGCRVPAENKLEGGNTFKDVNRVLKLTRGGVAWSAVGCQMGAFETALAYAKQREQFGRPIAGFQLVQDLLARMAGNVTASLGMAVRVAQLQEEGVFRDDHAALAKSYVTSQARQTVAWARELLGGNGILLEQDVVRYFNDAEALYSYEGTREINQLIVGRALTGVSAFV
ncbi:acyl-CoA dehydrogenase [Blastococcus sp. MG754426]|uniref:acyl-CoA dehydrogenase family protein n=1 Tax=unclassified Blastococcus TaxID=2619396 RepID=UPI001EF042F6|nr:MULTISPECIES: acyl-CoA dehydrogenase family protein [unclassified Blastococcus]MCF6508681.1 acyl-CoA dehydrogenase [Blastococcus sp. MG754426]MCF6513290.1 acyl-CoA dehydrogenase [Blastococcus sp. MG754427]MCF6736744.1 acyl-CoA dehydrogenase [Blastococcus sp. KM273129]